MSTLWTRVQTWVREQGLTVALSVLIVAVLAQIRIPLPFTPVPVTGQTLGVLLVGAFLAPADAALALTLYVLLGAAGLPFFTGFGRGWGHISGPTGGYILGFIPAAWITSVLIRHLPGPETLRVWVALLVGNLTIYLFGLPWLSMFVGWSKVLALGFLPFIPGDLFKLALAGFLYLGYIHRPFRRT